MTHPPTPRPAGRRVQLMATCLCDAFYDDVARATVEVLEHLGCTVDFPEGQTCCGQPAFNGGDWASSRRVVRHTVGVFAGELPVIVPSSSCAAMLFHGAPLEFEHEADRAQVEQLAGAPGSWPTLSSMGSASALGPGAWRPRSPFTRSCHSRGTATGEAALELLRSIAGITVLPFGEAEQCCGFGGTFSVTFPHISKGMGTLKLDHIRQAAPDLLVSIDQSCLMHLSGMAEKDGQPIRTAHFAQVLRDALRTGGKS